MADLAEQAMTLLTLRRPTEAAEHARRHLVSEPDSGFALRVLALALAEQRDPEARRVAEHAVRAEPDHAGSHLALSRAASVAGDRLAAVAASREAVRLAPQSALTHTALGNAFIEVDQPGLAMECARTAIDCDPQDPDCHVLLARVLVRQADPVGAEQALREALRLDPTNVVAANNLAALHLDHGKLRRASAILTGALQQDPQYAVLHHNHDLVWLKVLSRLRWVVFVSGVVLLIMVSLDEPWWVRALTGVGCMTIGIGLGSLVTRRLPRGSRRWPRGLFGRIATSQKIWLGVFAVALALVLLTAFAPGDVAAVAAGSAVILYRFLVIGWVFAWISRALRKRS